MGITVRYEPVGAIARTAFLGGLGRYQERQDDRAVQMAQLGLQQQRQNQDALMDRARLAANERAQNLDFMRDQQRMQFGAGIQQQRDQFQYEAEAAFNAEKQASAVQGAIAKASAKLSPEGRQIYSGLSGKLKAIQKQRNMLRPGQYASLIDQWLGEMQEAGLENHIQEPPTLDEDYETSVKILPDGSYAVRSYDAQGRPKFDIKPPAKKEAVAPTDPQQYFADPKVRVREGNEARRRLIENRKALAAQNGIDPDTLGPPSMADIQAEMLRKYYQDQEFGKATQSLANPPQDESVFFGPDVPPEIPPDQQVAEMQRKAQNPELKKKLFWEKNYDTMYSAAKKQIISDRTDAAGDEGEPDLEVGDDEIHEKMRQMQDSKEKFIAGLGGKSEKKPSEAPRTTWGKNSLSPDATTQEKAKPKQIEAAQKLVQAVPKAQLKLRLIEKRNGGPPTSGADKSEYDALLNLVESAQAMGLDIQQAPPDSAAAPQTGTMQAPWGERDKWSMAGQPSKPWSMLPN